MEGLLCLNGYSTIEETDGCQARVPFPKVLESVFGKSQIHCHLYRVPFFAP